MSTGALVEIQMYKLTVIFSICTPCQMLYFFCTAHANAIFLSQIGFSPIDELVKLECFAVPESS